MNRREILTGTSVVALGSLTGCLSSVFGGEDLEFVGFYLMNASEDELVFDAQVLREGEQVYEVKSHSLAARSGSTVDTYVSECDWEPSGQSFEMRCREFGGEWESKGMTVGSYQERILFSSITFDHLTDGWMIQIGGHSSLFSDRFCEASHTV